MIRLKEWLKLWPGSWSLPLAILTWFASPYFLRLIDPTAASYDAGVFQIILFASISMLVFDTMVWLGILLNFKRVFKYYVNELETDFKNLTGWQRIKVLLWLYFGFLASMVMLSRVIN